jgi:DNA-binding MarR family transcriptional regulator
LPASRPAAAWSWTAASSASGRRSATSICRSPASTRATSSASWAASLRAKTRTVRTPRPACSGPGYVQFQLLARLAEAHGQLTVTQLADGVVYSRSGLTYQAGLLEKAGLVTRGPSPDDERATLVTITENGLALFGRVLPGHIRVVRRLLFDPLSGDDLRHLGDIMTRVREHMRAQPPRSAAPRKRRPSSWARDTGA